MNCRLCHRPLDVLDRQRGLTLCRRAACQGRNEAQRIEAERRAMTEAGLAAVQRLHPDHGVQQAVWLLPYEAMLVPTQPEEREALRQALLRRVQESALQPWAPDAAPALPLPAAADDAGARAGGTLCARCRGRCCTAGLDEDAFLHDGALQRWLREHPGQWPAAAVEAYMAALPAEHMQGSCLFHGAQGCALPRERRGDTCNSFGCMPYRTLMDAVQQQPPQGVLVLRAKGGRLQSAWVVSPEGGAQALPPSDCLPD